MDFELWYTEEHTDCLRFTMKVKQHLYSKQSPFQKIEVLDTYEFGKVLILDGLIMITEKDEFIYHEMITHVPMAVNPKIKNVLVIGGGDGGTVRELTKYDSIQHIDMVEIDEMVVETAKKFFPQTSCKLDDKRVFLHFEDGIRFIQDKKDVYDLILVDSTDPLEGPGEVLFTKEFYQDCYTALTENGILINQNETFFYEWEANAMLRAVRKLKSIFPICKVYQYNMPTYPSGNWLFGFSSKKLQPLDDFQPDRWNALNIQTRYYNTDLHRGAFALPNYAKEMLISEDYGKHIAKFYDAEL